MANLISDRKSVHVSHALFPYGLACFFCIASYSGYSSILTQPHRKPEVQPWVTYLGKVANSYITNAQRKPHSCSPSLGKKKSHQHGRNPDLPPLFPSCFYFNLFPFNSQPWLHFPFWEGIEFGIKKPRVAHIWIQTLALPLTSCVPWKSPLTHWASVSLYRPWGWLSIGLLWRLSEVCT